jgi:hypothetical protein
MDFKTFYQGLAAKDRETFAEKIGTSPGYCHQIAYGMKQIELGLADAIVAHSGGKLGLADLPLTDRATFQHKARSGGRQRRSTDKAGA